MTSPPGARIETTPAAERRLLRRTRLRLAAWSGLTTLVVLVLLGATLYAVVAQQLADDSVSRLRARADSVAASDGRPGRVLTADAGAATVLRIAGGPGSPGYLFGGPLSGTLAVVVGPEGTGTGGDATGGADPAPDDGPFMALRVIGDGMTADIVASGPAGELPPRGAAEAAGLAAARAGREDLRETTIGGAPFRVLSLPLEREPAGDRLVVQVMSDMTAERRALGRLLGVLILGGSLVVVAAALAGWAYSGRALVPIRASLRRQRELAADASHELRTPLAALRADLEAVAALPAADRGASEALEEAIGETARMADLLEGLLLLARADAEAVPLDRRALDLAAEASAAVDDLEPAAGARGMTVVLDVVPTTVDGDAVRLRQLVTILLDNAIRYGRAGGHVWLSVGPEDGRARLVVADDGAGIRPADRERVFQRFWRAPDASGSGSGLGLAIGRWIADAHGGTIDVGERAGGGAELIVRLPR